eukprot:CAMPEP_0180076202 /NCGR_PEP_ID=MMETSP0985-20121206/14974_1 /TAXON_ID=483367 /ORGANISM="non described non described, Strain CCMP 2436" /LENGTH=197 /DNA_ID=CAMNT_0022008325 /DNA_START=717 /DNA_END=1310 /DNA_ORIENTATION=-
MVNVVVASGAKPKLAEERVPRVRVLGVNQREPRRVDRAEGHVDQTLQCTSLAVKKSGMRIMQTVSATEPLKASNSLGVEEAVVWLVARLVELGRDFVLSPVCEGLQRVHDQELRGHVGRVRTSLEGVVGRGHQVEHPGAYEVAAEQHEALGLRKVRAHALPEVVLLCALLLHGNRVPEVQVEVVVRQHEELAHHDGE